jgi:hypothetical protein
LFDSFTGSRLADLETPEGRNEKRISPGDAIATRANTVAGGDLQAERTACRGAAARMRLSDTNPVARLALFRFVESPISERKEGHGLK